MKEKIIRTIESRDLDHSFGVPRTELNETRFTTNAMLSDIFTQAFIKYRRLSLEKSSNVNELYKKNPYRKGPFRSNVNVPMVTDCHVRNSAYFPHTDVMIRPFIHLFLPRVEFACEFSKYISSFGDRPKQC